MGDLFVKFEAFFLKLLTGVLGTFFGYLNKKYSLGIDPMGIAITTGAIIIGIAHHYALKDHGVSAAKADQPAPGGGSTAAPSLLIGLMLVGLILGLSGCHTIDAKVTKDFRAREVVLMEQLTRYLDADVVAEKKSADDVADEKQRIARHLASVQADVRSVSVDEENALMAELMSYVRSDPKRDEDSRQAKADSVKAHLDLFGQLVK